MVIGKGFEDKSLSEEDVRQLASEAFAKTDLRGKKVLVLIPDHTRTAPIGMMFRIFHDLIGGDVAKLDYLVALGTHPPLPDEKILELVEITPEEREGKYKNVNFFNHRWDLPDTLTTIGTISDDEIEQISGGLMRETVPVALNKMILDYDQLIIVGPTFPHEVVGFSGGNKYVFPGIAGPDIINFFHWLGAVITNPKINGTKITPVRKVVDTAAAMVPVPRMCFSMVVYFDELRGLFIGTPEEAFSAAADLSDKIHIIYKDKPYNLVLSMSPKMYDDIWTAGKCMYKLEPVVADGGTLIIYAPHVTEISYTHGKILDEIGYHTRDYFLKQWDKFKHFPRGVTAHSTHVKGIGTYENGIENPRVNVILATRIPKERCDKVNLGYMDPDSINPADYEGREDEGVLCVHKAGEMLHRLKNPPAWARFDAC